MHGDSRLPRTKGPPTLKMAVIGLSQAPGLLKELQGSPLQVVAAADFDLRHPALQEAQREGVLVSQDYTEILERPNLDLVLNLIPDRTVEAIIHQLKPERTEVIHASIASSVRAFSQEFLLRRSLVKVLRDVSLLLSGFLEHKAFVGRVLREVREVTGADAAGLWLKHGEGFSLFQGLDLPPSLQDYPAAGDLGLFERLLEERTPVHIRDVGAEAAIEDNDPISSSGFDNVVLAPMTRDFQLQGALALFHAQAGVPSRELLQVLQVVVDLMMQVLEHDGAIQGGRDALIRDEITGLYNDVYFMDRLQAEVKRANRSESAFSLLYMTLRPERTTEYGDQLMIRPYLRATAEDLMATIRNVDVPSRCKQNDFAVILPDTSPAGALAIAERLLEQLTTVRVEGLGEHAVKMSIGVASYPDHALQPRELLDNAELAAFLASRDGQNRIRVFLTSRSDVSSLTPENIVRKYPALSEVFQVLAVQGAKDHHTFVHAQEVAHYASLMAREMGLAHEDALEIGLAGWLHDVGKMTLPGLNGDLQHRLSRLPALNVRIHPALGAFILKNLIRSPAVLKGILHHHARFDGQGQSAPVQGEGIPLEARILAVADTYQHLSRDTQGYRVTPQRDSFHSLRAKAGQELDPTLVECLIRGVTSGS